MKIPKFELSMILFLALTMNYCYASESSQMPVSNKIIPLDSATIKVQNAKALAVGRFGERIKFDDKGIPIEIHGDLSRGLTGTDVVDKAYQFLEINKDIFGIENAKIEFIVFDVNKSEVPIVKMYQAINGVKVASNIRLMFSRDGSLNYFAGKIDPNARNIDTKPSISEEQAKAIVISDLDKIKDGCPEDAQTEIKNTTLIIGRFHDELKLVWGLSAIKCLNGYGYWIDAQTGEILESGSSAIR